MSRSISSRANAAQPRAQLRSRPLLAQRIQTRLLQILRAHHNAELAVGLEVEKEGLRKSGNVGWILYVDQEDPAARSVLLSKVNRLRLDRFQDTPNDLARLPAFPPLTRELKGS